MSERNVLSVLLGMPMRFGGRGLLVGVVCAFGFLLPAVVVGQEGNKTVKGVVKGHNKLVNPVWDEASKPGNHRYTWREPSPTVRAKFRTLFGLAPKELCIVAISKAATKPRPLPWEITVGGGRTTPVTIVVTPGTRLTFRNNDPFKHRIYLVGDKSFPPADMAISAVREWTAPGPGTYEIRDELAPSLRSWVVVKPGVASIGYPDLAGKFFVSLPPGEYELLAYFAGQTIGKPRPVTVDKRDVDLTRSPMKVALPKKKDDAAKDNKKK